MTSHYAVLKASFPTGGKTEQRKSVEIGDASLPPWVEAQRRSVGTPASLRGWSWLGPGPEEERGHEGGRAPKWVPIVSPYLSSWRKQLGLALPGLGAAERNPAPG
ncbi:unnamed protein product [Gadus morhua 'NCC']